MVEFFLKNKNWIGYALYGIVLLPVLLYLMFPSDTLKDYVQASVQTKNPGVFVNMEKASLSFPLGLKLGEVECSIPEFPEETAFMADKIIIKPRLWSLFGKNPEYGFSCEAYRGTIKGRINLQKNDKKSSFSLQTEFENIYITQGSQLPAVIKDDLEGILAGAVTYKGNNLFDPDGTGEASLILSDCSINFSIPILDIDVIDLQEVHIKADLKGQKLNISETNIKGDDFLGSASGIISLKDPIYKSRLNLKCSLEPTAAFLQDSDNDGAVALIRQVLKNGSLALAITGTLEKPSFRLD